MYHATNETHASPSGAEFSRDNIIPSSKGAQEARVPEPVQAVEEILAGRNPAKTTGWHVPTLSDDYFKEFLDPMLCGFEYRFLANLSEDDDDEAFTARPELRRQAIILALEEVLKLIVESLPGQDSRQIPDNAYLWHGIRMAYRRTIVELLGLWYREERGVRS